jgi:DnaJ-class molecular chaperone
VLPGDDRGAAYSPYRLPYFTVIPTWGRVCHRCWGKGNEPSPSLTVIDPCSDCEGRGYV